MKVGNFALGILVSLSVVALAETPSGFEELQKQLTPRKEIWNSIPWHADLISAQHQAVKERKPIFIWSMDGHPLACT